MKVLVFNTLYHPNEKGGAEKSVKLVCDGLVKNSDYVKVISIWDGIEPKKDNVDGVVTEKWAPYNVYSVHNYDKNIAFIKKMIWQIIDLFNPFMFIKVINEIKKNNYDVVWSNNLSGFSISVWAAAFICGVPVVHTARDYYLLSNNVQLYNDKKGKIEPDNIISKCKIAMLKFLGKRISYFVGISNHVVKRHKPFLDKTKLRVIFNSVDLKKTQKTKKNKDGLVYGYIGQINKAKGVDLMIDNFLKNSQSSSLLIAGKAEEFYIDKYASERVKFK